MTAATKRLHETLDTLCRICEAQAEGRLASILLVEDGRVRHAAAPSLPAEWVRLIGDEPIAANRGPYGTAAYLKEPVIVKDLLTDSRWEFYRGAALQCRPAHESC